VSSQFKSEFVRAFDARGFMHQCTDLAALDELAATKTITAYIGFDATADSLHVGSLVQIMMLRRLRSGQAVRGTLQHRLIDGGGIYGLPRERIEPEESLAFAKRESDRAPQSNLLQAGPSDLAPPIVVRLCCGDDRIDESLTRGEQCVAVAELHVRVRSTLLQDCEREFAAITNVRWPLHVISIQLRTS